MRSRIITVAVLALVAVGAGLAAPESALAVRLGVYGTVGAGTTDWQNSAFDDFDEHRDTQHGGGGLVLETGSPYAPLAYRLAIGWERITQENRFEDPGLDLEGVVIDQCLNVRLIGGPGPLRVWAGPELRLGFLDGSFDGSAGDDDFLAIGVGPAIGFDFDVSPGMSISWKFGYLFTGYSGHNLEPEIEDSSLSEGHAYATLAILFSAWADYPDQPPPPQVYRQPPPPPPEFYRPPPPPPFPPPPPPPPPYDRW